VNRYGVFSVTGYPIGKEGKRGFRFGENYHDPSTTWFVFDSAYCGEVVLATPYEHVARSEVFKLNADERRWEKEQERGFARNGHP
jgi:hypothetical protein